MSFLSRSINTSRVSSTTMHRRHPALVIDAPPSLVFVFALVVEISNCTHHHHRWDLVDEILDWPKHRRRLPRPHSDLVFSVTNAVGRSNLFRSFPATPRSHRQPPLHQQPPSALAAVRRHRHHSIATAASLSPPSSSPLSFLIITASDAASSPSCNIVISRIFRPATSSRFHLRICCHRVGEERRSGSWVEFVNQTQSDQRGFKWNMHPQRSEVDPNSSQLNQTRFSRTRFSSSQPDLANSVQLWPS